ncbi:hypothetical protein Nepgr_006312 [Nepenthes gracilis]|uniref:GH18 domain-containing protein n=1 Tax=Nepenthes gracilis TaxID=150966 RepID=A0AAD3S4W1_NEPGR|nr:hypothetical protein Nepgr_006312 [Nepenthes gracilis]
MASSQIFLFSLITLLLLLLPSLSAAPLAVKAVYWFPDSGLPLKSINPTFFSHMFYAFAGLNTSTNQLTISKSNQDDFSQFTKILREKNPSIETIISIGGGGANASSFAAMASTNSSRKAFIDSSIELARTNNFSGWDLDWEYPKSQSDMNNLGSLLSEWRSALVSGNQSLILTAAVYYKSTVDSLNYPIKSMASNLDWINVMAYDFYAPAWSPPETQPHAALYDPTGQISGSIGVANWTAAGMPATKIALGMPFYGYNWVLLNPSNHGYLAPTNSSGGGAMTYSAIKEFIEQYEATTVFNSTVVENYCYSGTTWITYDDVQSITAKVSYAKQQGLLGYFAWHVGADDSNFTLSKTAWQT